MWLEVSATGGRLKPCRVFTEGHTGHLEFLGRWGAGKECFFSCLKDRWEQGAEWEGDEQMWKGKDRLSHRGSGPVDLHTSAAMHLQMSNWSIDAGYVTHISLDIVFDLKPPLTPYIEITRPPVLLIILSSLVGACSYWVLLSGLLW